MRIAQVSPLTEAVPPRLYGGTERVVSYLTEELVALGHEVTLFASGDSVTSARLVPCTPIALRLAAQVNDPLACHVVQLELLRQRACQFDVVHFHDSLIAYPLMRELPVPSVTTLHGRLDIPGPSLIYTMFSDAPVVAISEDQRRPLPDANWVGTVHHGLPPNLHPFEPFPRADYLAFLGRICPEKRVDRAIAIASAAQIPLRIAAKVDPVDEVYFRAVIAPLLKNPGVSFVGEITDAEKPAFLGNARALLFPIDWPEPFGLTMIEAMSCGTPVVAWARGSAPEVIDEGVTGFLVNSVDSAVEAAGRLPALSRDLVRARFEQRFLAGRMAKDYLLIYERLLSGASRAQFAQPLPALEPPAAETRNRPHSFPLSASRHGVNGAPARQDVDSNLRSGATQRHVK